MGGGGVVYLTLHCHYQNDCIKMSSDESHLNVLLIVMDKVTRQCPRSQLLTRTESRSRESNRDRLVISRLAFYCRETARYPQLVHRRTLGTGCLGYSRRTYSPREWSEMQTARHPQSTGEHSEQAAWGTQGEQRILAKRMV